MSTAESSKYRSTPDKNSSRYQVDEFNEITENDIDFEASYDGDSDMDSKSKLRRKLKKERKEAIMSGVDRVKQEDYSTEKHVYDSIKGTTLGKSVSAAYAPTSKTA